VAASRVRFNPLHSLAAEASFMATPPFDVESLSQALSADAPAGPDLEYDPAFAALELAGAGKPERQYGDKVYAAEPPDWLRVHEQALALAQRTRDLRVAMWLLRSAARLHGLAGAAAGLQLLARLLSGLWEHVYPLLDASEGNDPTMRLSALAPAWTHEAVLDDLRAASLVPVRGSLTLRQLELGLGRAEPHGDESVPTEAGVTQALQGLLAGHGDLAPLALAAQAAADAMASTLGERLDSSHAMDVLPLQKLLKVLTGAIAALSHSDERSAGADDAGAAPAGSGGVRAAAGAIASRADAVRELERVCEWIERHEPSNPAPILIRRAQRLMNKSFMEIMRDLAPGGLSEIQNLAGPEAQA
jgi:type VI secretion system protein ImpA